MNWREQLSIEEVIAWRRHMHQHPELSFEEVETANYIYNVLSTFPNLELSRPTTNSVIATLKGSAPGKTIALRGDIDALPIMEESDVKFPSLNPGVMHACGHDTHAAMLLGAAKVLSGMKEQLKGTIKFIFQPAEEVPPGGAKAIVEAGVLDDVEYVFGIHIFPKLEVGYIGTNVGAITAGQDIFELKIQGKGSHGSTPELSIDPITIGCEVVSNLNNIVSRHVGALDNAVLSIGQFTAGEVFNVIPDSATIKGTVRTTNPETRKLMKKRIHEVIDHLVHAYNGTYELNYMDGYSAVINNEEVIEIVRGAAKTIVGDKQFVNPKMMGSEDFSAYSDVCKGAFYVLGGGTEEEGCGYMNHHPKFKINEDALAIGVQMHTQIALDVLGK
ncbi:amidohydrolase [Paenibacillus sp. N1-5-1-14]|uniref:M20 metallopeptidase family protein n=1 Tax=Paenibacillus radicibacter TaxID=2972488 RepID=UPI002159151E|nr:amidohydrolase [Paenibacillus radicibacter]MCR8643988.1 amidohydrolase [Paenibacillus radicibacter]